MVGTLSSHTCSASVICFCLGPWVTTSPSVAIAQSTFGSLAGAVLTIRDSEFFKIRLVPLGSKTVRILTDYIDRRNLRRRAPDDFFFIRRNSKQIPNHMLERDVFEIRTHAGLRCESGPRNQPRLQDLRHTSAVNRLVRWYREGKEVRILLPQLSVYLGHTNPAAGASRDLNACHE